MKDYFLHQAHFIEFINSEFPDLGDDAIKKPISYVQFKTWSDIIECGMFPWGDYITYFGFLKILEHKFFVYTLPEKKIDFDKIVEDENINKKIREYIRKGELK